MIKIGLYSCGLNTYWDQFKGLKERLIGYGKFIENKMKNEYGVTVCNYGLVDSFEKGRECGEYFLKENVSLIFMHVATYSVSSNCLPVHRTCNAKTIILNLQPSIKINYDETDTGEWLAHCNACAVPEMCNCLRRANIEFEVINGLLGLDKNPEITKTNEITYNRMEAINAWNKIGEWIKAAKLVSSLKGKVFGFLGNYYDGMIDMYSDFTLLMSKFDIHIKILEMCDVKRNFDKVTDKEIENMLEVIKNRFQIGGVKSNAQEIKMPTADQLNYSSKVACALDRLKEEYNLDALAYYYHGSNGYEYEEIQSGFIVGCSLLTMNHVPAAGEADIKTCIAMKICDLLSLGGSFCEIVTTDYEKGTILIGHDGPFHIDIAQDKPILRGMEVYHGKHGKGISVEAKVKNGPVTTLGIAQDENGKVKFIVSEGMAKDYEIMKIGNTQTHVDFGMLPDDFMDSWFINAPTHHFALSIGHNKNLISKIGKLLDIETVLVN